MKHPITWFGRVVRLDRDSGIVQIRVGNRLDHRGTAFVFLFMDNRPNIGELVAVSTGDDRDSDRMLLAHPSGKYTGVDFGGGGQ